MSFNYYKPSKSEFNDCIAKGVCSVPPTVSALKEVIVMLLRHLAYYIEKLNKNGVECDELKKELVSSLAEIFTTADYSDGEVYSSILKNYNNLIQTKEFYIQLCKDKNIPPQEIRGEVKISPDMNLARLISLGEQIFRARGKKLGNNHKQLFDILLLITRNFASNIITLESSGSIESKYIDKVISSLVILNYPRKSVVKIKELISEIVLMNLEVVTKLGSIIYSQFGPVKEISVNQSSRQGKAILVSGRNLSDLFNLLTQLENLDIDVYTHSDLLIAHALDKFSGFKNLYGHYDSGVENFMLDFATFPGSILLTHGAVKNLEYLYRGRLFSTDSIFPVGVSHIQNNDFTALIDSAQNARGFKTGKSKKNTTVGYDADFLCEKLKDAANKFNSKEISKIFVIGMTSNENRNNDFYNKLLSAASADTFIITFGGEKKDKNILPINLANNVPLLFRLMNKFISLLESDYGRISFFISKCDSNSLSTMIALKELGFNNIYLSTCPPNAVNPQTINALSRFYGIKTLSNPQEDIKYLVN